MLGEKVVHHFLEILSTSIVVHFILFVLSAGILLYKLIRFHPKSLETLRYPIANIVSFGIGVFIEYFVFGAIYKGVYEVKDFGYHTPLYVTSIVALAIALLIFVNGVHFLYKVLLWKETKEENEKESV